MIRNSRPQALFLLLCMLVVTGCQSQYGTQKTTANYYPQCYRPIQDLRADENTTTNATAGGAAIGAVGGALLGLLITGKAEGAAVGAVAGAATGAVGGHVYGKNKAREQDQQKLAEYSEQLGKDVSRMDRASAAAQVTTECYRKQFDTAAKSFKSGQMNRIEFQNRYAEIRSGLQETADILKTTTASLGVTDKDYQQAIVYHDTAPVNTAEGLEIKKTSGQNIQQWQKSRAKLDKASTDVNTTLNQQETLMNSLLG